MVDHPAHAKGAWRPVYWTISTSIASSSQDATTSWGNSEVISDEEMDDLPIDSELAFVRVEQILRKSVEKIEFDARNNDFDPDEFRHEYMAKTLAAARSYKIEALKDLQLPRNARRQSIADEFAQFKNDVDFVTMQIRLQKALYNRTGSVGLNVEAKSKIHLYIQHIRDEIERNVDLDQDKKDKLLSSLNKFAGEVDRTRTREQLLGSLLMSFCSVTGAGFEKLKPVRELLDSISRVMGNAKSLEDDVLGTLRGPSERGQLAAPTKQIPPPSRLSDLDSDIRF